MLMTENKRFELKSWNFNNLNGKLYDNLKKEELYLSLYGLVDLLNEVSQAEYTLYNLKEDIIQKLDRIGGSVHDYNNEVSQCDNCHHYNPLITPNEGVFEQCLMGRILHRAECIEYDPIKEEYGE